MLTIQVCADLVRLMIGHSDRPSFITNQRRFNHHGGTEARSPDDNRFAPRTRPPSSRPTRIWRAPGFATAVDPTMAHGEEVQRVLYEPVRPARYVTWEYFSRQRLVASGGLAARGRPASRVLDVGRSSPALSIGLSARAGGD